MSATSVHRQELTPLHFLERAGEVYADRPAVIDGEIRLTWRSMRARARRLASALQRSGLEKGDRVAFVAFNSETLLLAHFGAGLAEGKEATSQEIIEHCKTVLAHFKAPRQTGFGPLPKTSTSKVQEYELREKERRGQSKRIH